ncbi:MAG: hypothetical protein KAU20_04755 [Nanoarchaeota archaeon]|nr:hypothetical protein [Nanoarchaeota archaeon]
MAYTNSDRFSTTGGGSVLIPEKWVPALEMDLPLLTFWNQFMAKSWGSVEIISEGEGQKFKLSYIQDTSVASTPLTAGTPIATSSSTGLAQTTGTLLEYGYSERIEGFANWLSNSDLQSASGVSTARNAVRTRNALIGAAYLASANDIQVSGTGVADIIYNGTTSFGTSPLLPIHVTAIVSYLRRLGIATFDDGNYRWTGKPGMFDNIKANAQVYSSASALNIENIYTTGEIIRFNGVIFIEEMGADAVTEWGTNAKSVIFGKNAVAGYDNFLRPDTVRFYEDDQNDFGRTGKIGWYGIFGAVRPCEEATNARSWVVYSSY